MEYDEPKVVLSLGAGVQSSTMALMFAHGEFEELLPMPEAAIFADTQAEPSYVYEWLDWLETQLPFPVVRVTRGNLKNDILGSTEGQRYAAAPLYTESPTSRRGGMLRRQCTIEYKLNPIKQYVRQLVGLRKGQRAPKNTVLAMQYIGISLDEAQRMKPAREHWIETRWPLIEKRMSRADCLLWMQRQGYPLPRKSSCTFCPYHNDAHWREMKRFDPASWADAVEIDRAIRNGVRGTREKLYLHRSLIPLEDVDLRSAEDHGQIDLFGNECDGMCGV